MKTSDIAAEEYLHYEALAAELLLHLEEAGLEHSQDYGNTLLEFISGILENDAPDADDLEDRAADQERKVERIYQIGNVIYAASLFRS